MATREGRALPVYFCCPFPAEITDSGGYQVRVSFDPPSSRFHVIDDRQVDCQAELSAGWEELSRAKDVA